MLGCASAALSGGSASVADSTFMIEMPGATDFRGEFENLRVGLAMRDARVSGKFALGSSFYLYGAMLYRSMHGWRLRVAGCEPEMTCGDPLAVNCQPSTVRFVRVGVTAGISCLHTASDLECRFEYRHTRSFERSNT